MSTKPKVRLSDAMRAGAKKKPHVRGAYICSAGTCALGAAMDSELGVDVRNLPPNEIGKVADTLRSLIAPTFPEALVKFSPDEYKAVIEKLGHKLFENGQCGEPNHCNIYNKISNPMDYQSVFSMVIHLNDAHGLTREAIADVIDGLFKEEESPMKKMSGAQVLEKMLEGTPEPPASPEEKIEEKITLKKTL